MLGILKFMKLIAILLTLSASTVLAAETIPEVRTLDELKNSTNKRVILEGVYHNPGKGDRTVNCGFIHMYIQDYSFKIIDKNGYLHETIQNGQKIRFEAVVRHYKGSKSLVETHPIVQEALPPTQVINGKEYYVYPDSYSIADAKLIRVINQAGVEQPATVPESKSEGQENTKSKAEAHPK
jgi:RecG-like helicase